MLNLKFTLNLDLLFLDIKLDTFTFISFTLFGTHIRAHRSSIVLQLPPH